MKKHIKEQAIQLRKEGWSYNIIKAQLGVSKSTLSAWLKFIPYTPNDVVRKRIKEGPYKSVIVKNKKRIKLTKEIKENAAKEIGKLSKRDLWMLGLGIYIGEGSKLYESIRVINSDPNVLRISVKWFRDICGLSNENFTLAIHLYPDTDQKEALQFWSEITKIPISQFGKTQVDKRTNKSAKKKRKLPYGTAHLTVRSNGDKNKGTLLHRRIIGWIEESYKQIK